MANAENAIPGQSQRAWLGHLLYGGNEYTSARTHADGAGPQSGGRARTARAPLSAHFQFNGSALSRSRGIAALGASRKGNISPSVFIPLAEASGQIVAIGDWVLEEACRSWRAWRDAGIDAGVLAINISRIQFRKRFSKRLAELMATYNIPPHVLELEITESVLLDDHSQVAEELSSLRAAGLTLSLDDFGTGFSSLSYLKRFRFDVLKIDRSFVTGLPDNPDDVLLVKAILAMAKGFDIQVVAEGGRSTISPIS
jgi:EAL domain-containing protein (putative c-di-GMP-specific phosphodiesterase class I)